MSHISTINAVRITSLDILSKACNSLNLILDLNRHTYKSDWTDQIDYAAAIITDSVEGEAAVVKNKEGSYEIQWDNYRNSLAEVIGKECEKLTAQYTVEAVVQQASQVGMVNSIQTKENGSTVIQGVFL